MSERDFTFRWSSSARGTRARIETTLRGDFDTPLVPPPQAGGAPSGYSITELRPSVLLLEAVAA